MVIEFTREYDEQVKDLLVELQLYIASIDKEGFNVFTPEYREKYFQKTLNEVQSSGGKILLYEEDGKIVGMIVGTILNEVSEYDFVAPKRGMVTELIISKKCRSKGYGKLLLEAMEEYFKQQGCKNILITVFGYNDGAIKFYQRNNYHSRVIDMTKNI